MSVTDHHRRHAAELRAILEELHGHADTDDVVRRAVIEAITAELEEHTLAAQRGLRN